MRQLFILLALMGVALGFDDSTPGLYVVDTAGADDYYSDTVAAIAAASTGDTVLLPEAQMLWGDQLFISKAITLKGQGSGGFIARSTDAETISEEEKTFTIDLTPYQFGFPEPNFVVGEDLVIGFSSYFDTVYMNCTVVSYTEPDLIVNVTSTVSGNDFNGDPITNENNWTIWREPTTTITSSAYNGADQGMLDITGTADGTIVVRDLKLDQRAQADVAVELRPDGHGILLYRCWFSMRKSGGESLYYRSNGSVVSECSFDVGGNWFRTNSSSYTSMKAKFGGVSHSSWSTVSTMGDDDTTGMNNIYVETSWFARTGTTTADWDANSRSVLRYCVLDSCDIGGHGYGSGSDGGIRHTEYYKNTNLWHFDGGGRRTPDIDSYFGQRGGTGVVYSNYFPDLDTGNQWGGDESEMEFKTWVINDSSEGPYGGWGSDDWPGHTGGETTWPATTAFPCPRQVGTGYVTGENVGSYAGEPIGELEPYYIWGNTGHSPLWLNVGQNNASGNFPTNPDSWTAYLKVDDNVNGIEEGTIITGEAKPGWAEYTYPHPLVTALESGTPAAKPLNVGTLSVGL